MFLVRKASLPKKPLLSDRAGENIPVTAKLAREGNKRERGKKGRISPPKCRRISYILLIFPRLFCDVHVMEKQHKNATK